MKHVIFTFIQIMENEKDKMESDPAEFVRYGADVCDQQKSETVKTEAAHLIEIMSDHIDGCLTYFTRVALEAIDFSVSGQDVQVIAQN